MLIIIEIKNRNIMFIMCDLVYFNSLFSLKKDDFIIQFRKINRLINIFEYWKTILKFNGNKDLLWHFWKDGTVIFIVIILIKENN